MTSQLEASRTDNAELSAKLSRLADQQLADQNSVRDLTSALEIARVQLIQLRGAGHPGQQEAENLRAELQTTRKSLTEALGNFLRFVLRNKKNGRGSFIS